MCSRGYLSTSPDPNLEVNGPSFLRVNSFVDEDRVLGKKFFKCALIQKLEIFVLILKTFIVI